jgi:hypothetical protein
MATPNSHINIANHRDSETKHAAELIGGLYYPICILANSSGDPTVLDNLAKEEGGHLENIDTVLVEFVADNHADLVDIADAVDAFSIQSHADLLVLKGEFDDTQTLLQTEFDQTQALIGAVTEVAPATDTASSGLNGRLQRVSQHLTTVEGKIDTTNTEIGATSEAAAISDTATSGLNGLIKRLLQKFTTFLTLLPASLGQKTMAGSFAVTLASDQTTVPVGNKDHLTGNILVASATATTTPTSYPLSAGGAIRSLLLISGTALGAGTVQVSVDGSTYFTMANGSTYTSPVAGNKTQVLIKTSTGTNTFQLVLARDP